MEDSFAVYHHTGLESSGGATRVARLLSDGLNRQDIESTVSFELGEVTDAAAILPEDFGRYLPKDGIAHLHCTGNWPVLLDSIPSSRKAIITLHDCELFTGGCPYPLGCSSLDQACEDPCPRRFPHSSELRKAKQRLVTRLEPVLVAPSRWLGRLAKKYLFRHVTIIPNGIPWPDRPPRKPEARRKLGINPSARVAIFVAHGGMDAAYKSGNAWRSIWTRIKEQRPEAVCFAVGGDSAGREGDLVIWPYVEREQLALLMTAADVLLYPTQADNHSMVLLEAMAHALPVVAYDVGGVPEQILHGSNGLLVKAGDEEAFVEKSVALLADNIVSRDLGQNAYSSGKKRFSVERMVQDYLKLYRDLNSR